MIERIKSVARHTLPASARRRMRAALVKPRAAKAPTLDWSNPPGPAGEAVRLISDRNFDLEGARIRATVASVLAASDRDLEDRRFLLESVRGIGVPFNIWGGYGPLHGYGNSSDLGMIQVPSEYVDLLLTLRRQRIRTFAEIGVDFGGFTVLTAAYLQRMCGLEEYHCIDVAARFVDRPHFERVLPLHFHVPATSNDLCGRAFDVVFCDGDHSYWWTKRDFLNLGRYARIFCLHDIKAHEYDHSEGGVTRFWAELKESYRERCSILEISHSGPDWMGIGMLFLDASL